MVGKYVNANVSTYYYIIIISTEKPGTETAKEIPFIPAPLFPKSSVNPPAPDTTYYYV